MRVLAWMLLLVGTALAGLGGARLGAGLMSVRAAEAPATMVASAFAAQQAAFARHAEALDAQRAGRPGAAEQVEQAVADIEAARERLAAYREAGAYDGSLPVALVRLQQQVPEGPSPSERLAQWLGAGGPWWGIGVLCVGLGALLARRSSRQASREGSGPVGEVDFPSAVREIREALDGIAAAIADLPMDAPSAEPRAEIDRVQDELITPLVEARGQLVARHGNATFAVYFGAFSAGERNLARSWSALTDGHTVVARASLDRARQAFGEALDAWERAERGS